MGAFNNRENADAVTLSFKGITELYKEYPQLHFLKAQGNKKTGRKYSKILSVTPECFLLPFMLSYTFHVFKYALVICKRKININKSGGRWTIPRHTLRQECQCGGANMCSQKENYPGNFHRTLHWNKTKAGSWEDGSSEGSEMNSVKKHFLVSQ